VEVGFDELGSDYNYTHQSLLLRNYLPIALDKRTANLNLRARLSWTNGQPFNKEVYELGGADSLRGYEQEYVTGNALALINLEYHHPLSGYPQLRGVLFADAGNVYADADALDLGRLNKAVGVGLRWKVQSFVNLTLRLDLAYGIDAETEFVYATTSGTF
jgi:outer membrane protein insertion porin family